MTRFVYVILIWVALIGLLLGFLHFRGLGAEATTYQPRPEAAGTYRLEVTATFTVEPDPFALTLNSDEQPPALLVQLAGRDIIRITDKLLQGEPLTVEPLEGLKTGPNEFFIRATPGPEDAGRSQALRLRLLYGDAVLTDQTVWSTPPDPIATTLTVKVPENMTTDDKHDDHDH